MLQRAFLYEEMAAILVYQTNPTGIEFNFYANIFYCYIFTAALKLI